jgi:hypothetical protein
MSGVDVWIVNDRAFVGDFWTGVDVCSLLLKRAYEIVVSGEVICWIDMFSEEGIDGVYAYTVPVKDFDELRFSNHTNMNRN